MNKIILLQNHLKIAFRNMWKFRVQTVVCVLGLSVGIDWWIIPATFLLISLVVIAIISAKIYFVAKKKLPERWRGDIINN